MVIQYFYPGLEIEKELPHSLVRVLMATIGLEIWESVSILMAIRIWILNLVVYIRLMALRTIGVNPSALYMVIRIMEVIHPLSELFMWQRQEHCQI